MTNRLPQKRISNKLRMLIPVKRPISPPEREVESVKCDLRFHCLSGTLVAHVDKVAAKISRCAQWDFLQLHIYGYT